MLDVQYLGVDPIVLPPGLGPVSAYIDGSRVVVLVDRNQMDPYLIDLVGPVSEEVLQEMAVRPMPGAPGWGSVRIERVSGLPLAARYIRPEFADDGAVLLRLPGTAISPAVVAAINGLGSYLLSQEVIPKLGVPDLV